MVGSCSPGRTQNCTLASWERLFPEVPHVLAAFCPRAALTESLTDVLPAPAQLRRCSKQQDCSAQYVRSLSCKIGDYLDAAEDKSLHDHEDRWVIRCYDKHIHYTAAM